jgi:hypothetical protein
MEAGNGKRGNGMEKEKRGQRGMELGVRIDGSNFIIW